MTQKDLRKFNSVIKTAQRIVGTGLPSLESIYNERVLKRARKILHDASHPGNNYFTVLPHKNLRTFKGSKRFIKTFYPSAVGIYNLHKR